MAEMLKRTPYVNRRDVDVARLRDLADRLERGEVFTAGGFLSEQFGNVPEMFSVRVMNPRLASGGENTFNDPPVMLRDPIEHCPYCDRPLEEEPNDG